MIVSALLLTAGVSSLTVRIEGDGYLRPVSAGKLKPVRSATLTRTGGALGTADGSLIAPKMTIAAGTLSIDLDGTVRIDGKASGRLVLAVGDPAKSLKLSNPGDGLTGVIRTGTPVVAAKPSGDIKLSGPINTSAQRIGGAPKIATSKPTTKPTKTTNGPILINIAPATTIDGERVLLGDVAEIQAPAKLVSALKTPDLGKAPILGTVVGLSTSYIRASIRSLGVKPELIQIESVLRPTVARRGVVVESQQIIDAVLALPETQGYVVSRPPTTLTVPPGELQILAVATGSGTLRSNVDVEIRVDGKSVARRIVAISPDPNVARVKIGDPVRIRMISGGIQVEVAGKVKTAGRTGESITATSSTGTVLTGTLISADLMEVRL